MRRARLKDHLGIRAVEAMNPEGASADHDSDYIRLYKTWSWFQQEDKPLSLFLPPPFYLPGEEWSGGFTGQQYQIGNDPTANEIERTLGSHWVTVRMDANRSNKAIIDALPAFLRRFRTLHHESKRSNPRPDIWREKHFLEAWDLRELKVTWSEIMGLFPSRSGAEWDLSTLRNAYNRAKHLINEGGWVLVARATGL